MERTTREPEQLGLWTLSAPLTAVRVAAACLCGLLALASAAEIADGKVNRRVGTYKGQIEGGGTVSFRITKARKVVGFTAAGVPQRCYTAPLTDPATQEQPKGAVTFGAPTLSLDKSGKFFYANFSGLPGRQPGPFREISLQAKPRSRTTLEGKVFLHTANGDQETAGTEVCTTGEPEWTASKVGRKKKR